MAKFWQTKSFKQLNEAWGKKLKESGFKDAEKNERFLKQKASYSYRRKYITEEMREAKRQYFGLINENIGKELGFHDDSDRFIMEKTGEGWKIREISEALKSAGMKKHNRDTIRYIRRRYENKWGIKNWTQNEMVSRKVKKS